MREKKMFIGLVGLTLTALLTACNKPAATTDSATDTAKPAVESGYVYVPTFKEIGGESEYGWSGDYSISGDALYYTNMEFDESTGQSRGTMYEYSLGDASVKELPVGKVTGDQNLHSYVIDEKGNFYGLFFTWVPSETDEYGGSQSYELVKNDSAGTEIYRHDITDIVSKDEYSWVENFCVDGKGRVYLSMESVIQLFDESGEYKGNIDTGLDWIHYMGVGKDGNVYVSYYDYAFEGNGMLLSMLDFEGKSLGTKYSGIPDCNGFIPGVSKDFVMYGSTEVFEYDMATQTCEKLYSWLDVDINGDYVERMGAVAEDKLVAIVQDWNTGETELAILEKRPASEVKSKTVITLGTFSTEQALQAYAVKFNKSNDTYRIKIQNYYDATDYSETAYEDAIARFNNEVMAGNGPDILELSGLNESQLVAKGIVEDLNPYLEQSDKLGKEDFVEGILEKFTTDGVLASIPRTVQLQTVVGKTAVVGDRTSWTLDDMMKLAEQYPDAELFSGMAKNDMLYYCMMFNGDAFVDWQEGTTNFDSDEFKKVLNFVNMLPDEFHWEDYESSVSSYQEDKVLLEIAYISDFQQMQYYEAMFNGPVSYVGFPMTSDEGSTALMALGGRYAISASSEVKEAAWEFIEGYLLEESEMFDWGFSTIQAKLDDQVEEATRVEYMYDENGEIMYDENGEPITYDSGMSSVSTDGWEYVYHTPTEEEAKMTLQLLSIAEPVEELSDFDILAIIQEEADAFFKGQKTVDEVAAIIQNRASIYVSENS